MPTCGAERQAGSEGGKYGWLAANSVASTPWTELSPRQPGYLFIQRDEALLAEYETGWSIADIFCPNGRPAPGIVTTHDQFAISWTSGEAESKVKQLLATPSEEEARKLWRLCSQNQWVYERAKEELQDGSWRDRIEPILYRPFDVRYTVFDRNVAVHRRERVMRHMLAGDNLGISTTRATEIQGGFEHVFVSKHITQHHTVSLKEVNYLFPLYIYPTEQEIVQGVYQPNDRHPNLDPRFTAELAERLSLQFINDGRGDLESSFGPEDVFHYIYAVLHSPRYRERYAQFLRADFPRIPPPNDRKQFRSLAGLGRESIAIHLLEPSALDASGVEFPIPGENAVDRGYPKYVAPGEWVLTETKPIERGRVYIGGKGARGQYFEGIAPDVWQFRIGGYQPLDKWLKDRKGRELTFDDLEHYRRIVAALRETIRLMAEIDQAAAV